MTKIIQNPETKEIVGCYTLIGEDGTKKAVKARKGVIMCTGGFELNEEMKDYYLKCSPFKFEGWRWNTGDGMTMVEKVGAKLWHTDMAISMYSMWTRDPEYDFSILYFMPAFSYFETLNRLGRRFVDENKIGSPHNGWHTLSSFSDEIDDYDRIPTWCIFDQSCFSARASCPRLEGDFFECGNFASDLPEELRAWDGWSQDNKAELECGWILTGNTIEELGQKIKECDEWMDIDALKATFDEYQGFCDAGADARFDRSAETLTKLDGGPGRRNQRVSRFLLHAGRPEEERQRPGARPRRQPDSPSVRRWLLRQLPEPQLRHHGRQQRRESGLGPDFRAPLRRS